MTFSFPFSAVVGHDDFKLALLTNAVDARIGGVLATGDRGSAKSTVVRSFSSLMPRSPGDGKAPFVELPLGAGVERLTGSIDSSRLLAGDGAVLRPGLLAQADGGILYVDEVNLLGDHLVDVLLDAAAFGVVRTERDGLSAEYSANFVLVGTMNPEEGDLRPQLLDRFGLCASVTSPQDATTRSEIVARRLLFERDPGGFGSTWDAADAALRERIAVARDALPGVVIDPATLTDISNACSALGVEGLRGDLVTARTAAALAALDARRRVTADDVLTAARLALPHRARGGPVESRRFAAEEIAAAFAPVVHDAVAASLPLPQTAAATRSVSRFQIGESPEERPATTVNLRVPTAGVHTGRGAASAGADQPAIDARRANAGSTGLDPIATARAAVTRRLVSGGPALVEGDLMQSVRSGRQANLVLCVVDASSSVFEHGRGDELRSLLAGLVADARRKRDRVGLIVFRGREARLVAPPSRNHAAVLAGLDTVEPGGLTPLADGICVAHETALRELRRNPDLRPVVALVTDGYANVPKSGDALNDAIAGGRELRRAGIELVVIGDPASGAPEFARATGAQFHPFGDDAATRRVA